MIVYALESNGSPSLTPVLCAMLMGNPCFFQGNTTCLARLVSAVKLSTEQVFESEYGITKPIRTSTVLLCQPFTLRAYCSFFSSHGYLLRTLVSHSGWQAFSTS
jgi:hypothetical protein